MYTHALNPTILHLGPLEIRWYGLMYVIGFLITYYYGKKAIEQGWLKLTLKEFDDMLGWLVIAMIAGARTFYAIFYNPHYFIAHPHKFFFVWEGGLSFHGALLAVVLTGFWYARKHKITFLHLADIIIVPVALANGLGRIGNFINGELYGVATNLPWGVVFPGVAGARHPTQLYEAAYNFVIFGILYANRKKLKMGQLFALFLMLYSVFRFSVEFIKDLPSYGPLTMGQWLTIPMFLLGVWLYRRNL